MKVLSILIAPVLLFYSLAPGGRQKLVQAEDSIRIQEVIQRFAKAETENRSARINYTFTLDYKLVELDAAGSEAGQFNRVTQIKLNDHGQPFEKIVYYPPSTLSTIHVMSEDIQDSLGIQPFTLTEEDLPKYRIEYLGRERLTELDTYKFEVKPRRVNPGERYLEGRIWVEAHDLQIVKIAGVAVPETNDQRFPRFETYREKIDGHWFPVYTYADDVLRFKRSPPAHVRMTIRYSGYKKFRSTVCVVGEDSEDCEKLPVEAEAKKVAAQPDAAELQKAYQLQDVVHKLSLDKKYREAIPNAERMVAIYEGTLGSENLTVAEAIDELAGLYWAAEDYTRAEHLLQRVLEIKERVLGRDHPALARPLERLVEFYYATAHHEKAEPYLARALPMFEKAGESAYTTADLPMSPTGGFYLSKEDSEGLERIYLNAVAFREQADGKESQELVNPLRWLARVYMGRADYPKAESVLRRAQAIMEKVPDPDPLKAANCINDLGATLYFKGEYPEAEKLLLRAVAILEKRPNPRDTDLTPILNNLGLVYYSKGEYAEAERRIQRAMTITEKAYGAESGTFGLLLGQLGTLHLARGNLIKSRSLLLSAAAILEKDRGNHSPDLAQLYSNLGALYFYEGDYLESERRLNLALKLKEEAVGADHPDLTPILSNLATLYMEKGDYAGAEHQLQRALPILEKTFRPDHMSVGLALTQLGSVYILSDEPEKAEPTLRRAFEILEKERGAGHKDVAIALIALARLYSDKEEYEKAEALLLRAQAILDTSETESVYVASILVSLASIDFVRKEYAKAESKLESALATCEKGMGPNHPSLATILHILAILSEIQGKPERAVELTSRAVEISERNLARNIGAGSERQKLLYLSSLSDELDHIISLHVRSAPKDRQAFRLALTTLLTRKGRALDVMTDIIRMLRRNESQDDELVGVLDALTDARSRYSALIYDGAGDIPTEKYRLEVEELAARIEKLDAEIGTRDPKFQPQPVTLEAVKDALPRDAALVEFVSYNPFDVKTGEWDSPRYVAYILKGTGEPEFVDLGDAEEIDEKVSNFRKSLRETDSDFRKPARALDEQVMRPVRERLGKVRRLFISPDAALNLFPFAALVDENGRYLVENYFITYLTSGRDLLRLKNPLPSRQGALVITNPNFDSNVNVAGPDAPSGGDTGGNRRSREFQEHFSSLDESAAEGTEVGKLLPDATVLSDAQATEAAVKKVGGPRILHLSTHGFFMRKQTQKVKGLREMNWGSLPSPAASALNENPLLRSGLALAGANLPQSVAGNDGILTALEAAGLDLWGTKLVVLSACETGLGAVQNGEGVYGLRRALVLAGAESQVMSLWRVESETSRVMMVKYYKRLVAGEGRGEALRQVQLEMLREYRHPYFWAGFIQSGDWRSLNGDDLPTPPGGPRSAGRPAKPQRR
jgi:CHAT domain-containing protein/Tfp pilus assembly protein PilF